MLLLLYVAESDTPGRCALVDRIRSTQRVSYRLVALPSNEPFR